MKIKNGVLLEVNESDLVKGKFFNKEVIELSDKCFWDMDSLIEVNLPNCTTMGSYCLRSNQALTRVNLPNCTTMGSDCLSSNQALTRVNLKKHSLSVKNVDGYCYVTESIKTTKGITIYSGYNFISLDKNVINKDVSFVAEKDNFTAHGETIKKAIQDVQFKIIAEKLKNEPIKKDTIITVNYYRLITGACEQGCKSWMNQHNVEVTEIKAVDLLPLLEKTHAYGIERFKSLITF